MLVLLSFVAILALTVLLYDRWLVFSFWLLRRRHAKARRAWHDALRARIDANLAFQVWRHIGEGTVPARPVRRVTSAGGGHGT